MKKLYYGMWLVVNVMGAIDIAVFNDATQFARIGISLSAVLLPLTLLFGESNK